MNELALFAGAGGGILGGKLLGWRTVCAVEWEAYPASVLCARQNDGFLPPFPIWDDVQTFDGRPWRGIVDVVSGGFPCQDISVAGSGDGIDGQSSGMWREMSRIIGEVRPRYAFVENSPMLVTRGLERVLADLTAMGYDSRWGVVSASDIGANHQRRRIWIVANSRHWSRRDKRIAERGKNSQTERATDPNQISRPSEQPTFMADSSVQRYQSPKKQICTRWDGFKHKDWWSVEPNVGRVADGVAARVDRLKAIGNGQVPLCAATAWQILTER